MRLLGLDYGTKRIGVAISDETQTLAREIAIVAAAKALPEIEAFLAEFEVEGIVLGWPLGMQAQTTEKTKEAENFKTKLEKRFGLPVYLSDERLSSMMAEKIMGKREHVDGLAAQIMLQNYLDKSKNERGLLISNI